MADINDEKIRDLAYQLWERDGKPEGKDEDYWHAAEKLLADDSAEQDPMEPDSPDAVIPIPPTRI